jgi:ankyrin repeat protein
MNIFDTKRGLNLAAMLLGTSSMVAPSLHALTQAEENGKKLVEGWPYYKVNTNGSRIDSIADVIDGNLYFGGIDFYYPNKNGNTVLHLAARNGDLDVVKLLMEFTPSLYKKNNDGQIPAAITMMVLKSLEETGKSHTPIAEKYREIDNILKEATQKAQENTPEVMEGWLRDSTANGSHSPAIRRGVNPNYQNEKGYTLLHFADLPDDVELLIKLGASPFVKNNNNETPRDLTEKSLARYKEYADEYIKNSKPIPPYITKRIEKWEKNIAILEQAEEEMAGFRDGI